jgi:hypothetical protein
VGKAAWIDVHVAPGYSVSLPKQAPDDAPHPRQERALTGGDCQQPRPGESEHLQ